MIGLRGHKLKSYKPQVRLDIRKYFFSIRVIEEWHSLPVVLINYNHLRKELTATLVIGDIHKFTLSFFPRNSRLGWLVELRWVELMQLLWQIQQKLSDCWLYSFCSCLRWWITRLSLSAATSIRTGRTVSGGSYLLPSLSWFHSSPSSSSSVHDTLIRFSPYR